MTKQDAPTTTDAERAAYVVPDGWKLVPVQPTQEMCQQGQWKAQEWPKFPLRIVPIWQAMLGAALNPPLPRDALNIRQSGVGTQADSILLCISDLRNSARVDDATSMRECVWAVSYRLAMLAIQAGSTNEAARASSAAAQWLPIETAPKDGTEILGHTDVGALVLYWDTLSDNPERWSDGMSRYHRMPTHWMPLPAPPAKPADTGEASNG